MLEKLLLGCCGSVAIFTIPNLVVTLRMVHRTEVQAVMTESAQRFLTATALEVLTGKPVQTGMFGGLAHNHISYITSHPVFLIAPATSNMIAKIANGISDEIVSLCASVCLGSATKLVIAPAMNPTMWRNPVLEANVRKLKELGVRFIGPGMGIELLTMQESAIGGMADIALIIQQLLDAVADGPPAQR
jgi:phosphopantothenoylcysteine decarboxylase/phosphopantothenate--cysteine ligase